MIKALAGVLFSAALSVRALVGVDQPTYREYRLYNPAQQSFPSSLAEVAAAGFSSNVIAGWAMQDGVGHTVTNTGGSGAAWDSGAISVQAITGDGYVECRMPDAASLKMVGLAANNAAASYTSIDYGIFADNGGNLSVYELGVATAGVSAYVANDVIRVTRVGSTVKYSRNGVVFYTSAVASSGSLHADVSMLSAGTSVDSLRLVAAGIGELSLSFTTILATATASSGSGAGLHDFSANMRPLTKLGTRTLIGQRANGLFDGASFRSQRCIEWTPGGTVGVDDVRFGDTTALDFDGTTPFSFLVVYRYPYGATTGSPALFSKGTSTLGAYGLYSYNLGIAWRLRDAAGTTVTVDPGAGVGIYDGDWHWALVRYDPAVDLAYADADTSPGTVSASTAALGSFANAVAFKLGAWTSTSHPGAVQIRGVLAWNDVATTPEMVRAWWKHGSAPAWMTYARASSFHSVVADDATVGDVVAGWSSGRVAYGYNALTSTNPLKLGLSVYPAVTNLLPVTDMNDSGTWAESGTTRTEYAGDGPRGFRSAIRHTKSNSTDRVIDGGVGASVTAAAQYTASVWCYWDGAGAAPILRVYRADASTVIGTVSATQNDSRWHRLSLTFTAPATEVVRLAVMGSSAAATSGSAMFDCPMINSGNYAAPWVPTKGATAATVAVSARATVAGLTSDYGTIKAWVTCGRQDSAVNRSIATAQTAAGFLTNERLLYISTGETVGMYDSSTQAIGAAVTDLATAEIAFVGQWDDSARYGWTKRVSREPSSAGYPATNAAALPAMTANTVLYLGSRNGSEQLEGELSKVRVWRDAELAA